VELPFRSHLCHRSKVILGKVSNLFRGKLRIEERTGINGDEFSTLRASLLQRRSKLKLTER
jgi:hypothetical protein